MRFIFMFWFIYRNSVVSMTKVLYTQHDCAVVAADIEKHWVRLLVRGGLEPAAAEDAIKSSITCSAISGPGGTEVGQAGDP